MGAEREPSATDALSRFEKALGPKPPSELRVPQLKRAVHGDDRAGDVTDAELQAIEARIAPENALQGFEEGSLLEQARGQRQLLHLRLSRAPRGEREFMEHYLSARERQMQLVVRNREKLTLLKDIQGKMESAGIKVEVPKGVEQNMVRYLTALSEPLITMTAFQRFNALMYRRMAGTEVPDAIMKDAVRDLPKLVAGRSDENRPIAVRLEPEKLGALAPKKAIDSSIKKEAEHALFQQIEWLTSFAPDVPGVSAKYPGNNPLDVYIVEYLAAALTLANEKAIDVGLRMEKGSDKEAKLKECMAQSKQVRDAMLAFQKLAILGNTQDFEAVAATFMDQRYVPPGGMKPEDLRRRVEANMPSREEETKHKDKLVAEARAHSVVIKEVFNTDLSWDWRKPLELRNWDIKKEDFYKKNMRFKYVYPMIDAMMRFRALPVVTAKKAWKGIGDAVAPDIMPEFLKKAIFGKGTTFEKEIQEAMDQVKDAWALPKEIEIDGKKVPFDFWDPKHWEAIPKEQWEKIKAKQESTMDVLNQRREKVLGTFDKYGNDVNLYDTLWKFRHPAEQIGVLPDEKTCEELESGKITVQQIIADPKCTPEQISACWLFVISEMFKHQDEYMIEAGDFSNQMRIKTEKDIETGAGIPKTKEFPWWILAVLGSWLAAGFVTARGGPVARMAKSILGPVNLFLSRRGGRAAAIGGLAALGLGASQVNAAEQIRRNPDALRDSVGNVLLQHGFKYDAGRDCFVLSTKDGKEVIVRIDKDIAKKLPNIDQLDAEAEQNKGDWQNLGLVALLLPEAAASGVGLLAIGGYITVEVTVEKNKKEPMYKFVKDSEPFVLAYYAMSEAGSDLWTNFYWGIEGIAISNELLKDPDIQKKLLFCACIRQMKEDKRLLMSITNGDLSPDALNDFYYGDFQSFVVPLMSALSFTQLENEGRSGSDFKKETPWSMIRDLDWQAGNFKDGLNINVPSVSPQLLLRSAKAALNVYADDVLETRYYQLAQSIRALTDAGRYEEAAQLELQERSLPRQRVLGSTLYTAHEEITMNAGERRARWQAEHPDTNPAIAPRYVSRARIIVDQLLKQMNANPKMTLEKVEAGERADLRRRSVFVVHGDDLGKNPRAYPKVVDLRALLEHANDRDRSTNGLEEYWLFPYRFDGFGRTPPDPTVRFDNQGAIRDAVSKSGSVAHKISPRRFQSGLEVDRILHAQEMPVPAWVRLTYGGSEDVYMAVLRSSPGGTDRTFFVRQTKDGSFQYKEGELKEGTWQTVDKENVRRFLLEKSPSKSVQMTKKAATEVDLLEIPSERGENERLAIERIMGTLYAEKDGEKVTDKFLAMYRAIPANDLTSRRAFLRDLVAQIVKFDPSKHKIDSVVQWLTLNAKRGDYGHLAKGM